VQRLGDRGKKTSAFAEASARQAREEGGNEVYQVIRTTGCRTAVNQSIRSKGILVYAYILI
jgi:hypothetical protein